jgi:hypothetical protein
MNPMSLPSIEKTRSSEIAGHAPKQYGKRAMSNEEAI